MIKAKIRATGVSVLIEADTIEEAARLNVGCEDFEYI